MEASREMRSASKGCRRDFLFRIQALARNAEPHLYLSALAPSLSPRAHWVTRGASFSLFSRCFAVMSSSFAAVLCLALLVCVRCADVPEIGRRSRSIRSATILCSARHTPPIEFPDWSSIPRAVFHLIGGVELPQRVQDLPQIEGGCKEQSDSSSPTARFGAKASSEESALEMSMRQAQPRLSAEQEKMRLPAEPERLRLPFGCHQGVPEEEGLRALVSAPIGARRALGD